VGLLSPSAGAGPRTCFGSRATEVGTKRGDFITGTKHTDVIIALGGRDLINGRGGDDLICAGRGIDAIVGRGGTDSIDGGQGADSISGGTGADLIRTGKGFLNFVSGDGGNDSIRGGPGLDIVDYFTARRPIRADLAAGTATGHGNDLFHRVDGISGSDFGDTLNGDSGPNVLIGGGGDDLLASGGNAATLETPSLASASDILAGDGAGRGRDGNDVMTGGAGVNVMSFSGARSKMNVSLQDGTASGEGEDTFSEMNVVIGSYFDDTLIGDDGDNAFQPLDGDDIVEGAAGRDVTVFTLALGVNVDLATGGTTGEGRDSLVSIEDVWASDFNDQLDGDDNDNRIYAFGGADRVAGHGGNDLLDGGPGLDSLDGGPDSDSCLGGEQTSECEDDAGTAQNNPLALVQEFRVLRAFSSGAAVQDASAPEQLGDGPAEELVGLWVGGVRQGDDEVPGPRRRKFLQAGCDPIGSTPQALSPVAGLGDLLRLLVRCS
jgi:Ca2+-binding RTX toxin-like protein